MKQLGMASYTDGNLDQVKVEKIAKLLNRKTLKQYIKALKNYEKQNTVYISLSSDVDKDTQDLLKNLFLKKKKVFKKDEDLLLGIKVANNDLIYETSLKNSLDALLDKIKQTYD